VRRRTPLGHTGGFDHCWRIPGRGLKFCRSENLRKLAIRPGEGARAPSVFAFGHQCVVVPPCGLWGGWGGGGALLAHPRAQAKVLSLRAGVEGRNVHYIICIGAAAAAAGGADAHARGLGAAHEGYCSKAPMWWSPCSLALIAVPLDSGAKTGVAGGITGGLRGVTGATGGLSGRLVRRTHWRVCPFQITGHARRALGVAEGGTDAKPTKFDAGRGKRNRGSRSRPFGCTKPNDLCLYSPRTFYGHRRTMSGGTWLRSQGLELTH
jgi:hypothetical protein